MQEEDDEAMEDQEELPAGPTGFDLSDVMKQKNLGNNGGAEELGSLFEKMQIAVVGREKE